MSWREPSSLKLDYEDLVKELDQFEQEASSLQDRINQFIDSARQVSGDDPGDGLLSAEGGQT